jgi:hypothetical protein
MIKNIFIIFFLILILITNISSTQSEEDYEKAAEDYKINYIKEFREKVKKYLSERHLYKNESALISKAEFRSIFRDIMSGGDEGNVSEGFGDTFKSLTELFVKDAFPEGVNYLKGNKIHTFFEYENIMDKFNKYMAGMTKQYNPDL